MERHDTCVIGVAAGAPPGDALVGVLLGDLGFEVALDAPDAHLPAVVGVVDLGDRLDLVEEVREALELRPLVVGDLGGHVDVDGLDDLHHSALLLSGFLLSIQHGTGRSASGVDCRRGYCPGRACEVLLRRLVVKTCADATSVSYVQTTVHFSGGTRIMNRSPRRAIAVATALVCTAALASCAVGTGSGDDADATIGVGNAAEEGVGEKTCATVEKMGKDFSRSVGIETLRARRIVEHHFYVNG